MRTKEVKYFDEESDTLVREKLMVRRIVEGRETIEEAIYSSLERNIEVLYDMALQGKRILTGLLKVYSSNRRNELFEYIRSATDYEEGLKKISTEFKVSKEVAGIILDMRLSNLTHFDSEQVIKSIRFYEKAVECLKPLRDMQKKQS